MDAKTMLLASFRDSRSRRAPAGGDFVRNLSKVKALIEHIAEAVLILQADTGKVLVANQSAVLLFEAEEPALQQLSFDKLSQAKPAARTWDYRNLLQQGETLPHKPGAAAPPTENL